MIPEVMQYAITSCQFSVDCRFYATVNLSQGEDLQE